MRKSVVAAFVLLSLIGTGSLLAQTSASSQLNITGAGARALGMGGAFIGVADDATAIVWNPAGLTQLERMEVSAVGRYVWENIDYSNSASPESNQSELQTHPVFNFGSFAVPFGNEDVKVVIAAAYQRQLDFYYKKRVQGVETEETGGADCVSPGIALGFGSIFSVGLAANVWFGKDDYNYRYEQTGGVQGRQEYHGTAKGTNYLAGVLVDLHGLRRPIPIKFGACVRTPFDLNFDYNLLFAPPVSGYTTIDASVTHQMPLMVGFGVSVRPVETLTFSADYEMRRFGDRQSFTTLKARTPIIDTSDLSESKSDLNQFRAGIEYLVVTRAGVFPLRAGYMTVPTLLADWNFNPATNFYDPGDQVKGNGFSVGTGFISNSFALDLTYTWAKYEQFATANGRNTASYTYKEQALTGSLIVYF